MKLAIGFILVTAAFTARAEPFTVDFDKLMSTDNITLGCDAPTLMDDDVTPIDQTKVLGFRFYRIDSQGANKLYIDGDKHFPKCLITSESVLQVPAVGTYYACVVFEVDGGSIYGILTSEPDCVQLVFNSGGVSKPAAAANMAVISAKLN